MDRIFSRIGTADDLAGGHSTFMVESAFPVSAGDPGTPEPVLDALRELDPDELSPRQALETLYRLQVLAQGLTPGRARATE